jgi:hypothetical protein
MPVPSVFITRTFTGVTAATGNGASIALSRRACSSDTIRIPS